jgi:hypothetical protein
MGMPTTASAMIGVPPHGVDVRQGVGGGDASEIMRVIHHRREEIGGRHDRLRVVQAIHGGVVGMLGADHEVRRHEALRHRRQHVGEQGRRNLAAAAATVGKLGQTNIIHGARRTAVRASSIADADAAHETAAAARAAQWTRGLNSSTVALMQ